MECLVTYDIDTSSPAGRRRLRRVAKICEGYGIRVQKSVFEVVINEVQYLRLGHDLNQAIDPGTDNIRIYRLTGGSLARVQHLGSTQVLNHHADHVL